MKVVTFKIEEDLLILLERYAIRNGFPLFPTVMSALVAIAMGLTAIWLSNQISS